MKLKISDYLMIYGWAFFIIMLFIGAIVYVVIPKSPAPETVSFTEEFTILDYNLTSRITTLAIQNNKATPVLISEINVTNCIHEETIFLKKGDKHIFNIPCPRSGSGIDPDIKITYTEKKTSGILITKIS